MTSPKQLIVINGTMGVGKSTTARALAELLQPCFYLDGDWCWAMSPFAPTEADKALVRSNIVHLLRGFLASERPYVIFSWVLHEDAIWHSIAEALTGLQFRTQRFTLTCEPDALRTRLSRDVVEGRRKASVIERSVARLGQFDGLATQKIDVTHLDAAAVAQRIAAQVESAS